MSSPLRVRWHPAPDRRSPSPYIHQLADALVAHDVEVRALDPWFGLRGCEIVHVHWPENLYRTSGGPAKRSASAAYAAAMLTRLRLPGAAVVYTAHNPAPHDGFRSRGDAASYTAFLGCVDVVICHHDDDRHELLARWPELRTRRFVTIGHGPIVLGPARTSVPPGPPRLVALGRVAPYKQLGEVIDVWPVDAATLHVAGECLDHDLGSHLETASAGSAQITVELARLSDDRLHELLVGAHAALALQRDGLTSGVAIAALSHGVPVVMRPGPQADTLLDRHGPSWVHVLDRVDQASLAEAVRWARTAGTGPSPTLQPSWDDIAERTAALYRELRSG